MQTLEDTIPSILERIDKEIDSYTFGQSPKELYEPIHYILSIRGKRIRPLLVLMSGKIFNDHIENLYQPALAVEVFHNFTLMHDDIMDAAPLRRGLKTVHEKYNTNIAILSGDVMLVKAYDMLLSVPNDKLATSLKLFNTCAAEVCEGQQLDMNFEQRTQVTEDEYIEMIRLKTAVLLGFAMEWGAYLSDASAEDCEKMKSFGIKIGVGFQIKDDLLDAFGESAKTGKQLGGDIIANKKTFLLIKALENANPEQRKELEHWLNVKEFNQEEKIKAVLSIFNQLNIRQVAEAKMNAYFEEGFSILKTVKGNPIALQTLETFTQELIRREK